MFSLSLTPVSNRTRSRRSRTGEQTESVSGEDEVESPVRWRSDSPPPRMAGLSSCSTPTSAGRSEMRRTRLLADDEKNSLRPHTKALLDIYPSGADEEEEYTYVVPNTQYQLGQNDGDVYWDLSGSPETKERFRRKLEEAEARSPGRHTDIPDMPSPNLNVVRKPRSIPPRVKDGQKAGQVESIIPLEEWTSRADKVSEAAKGDQQVVVPELGFDDSIEEIMSQIDTDKAAKDTKKVNQGQKAARELNASVKRYKSAADHSSGQAAPLSRTHTTPDAPASRTSAMPGGRATTPRSRAPVRCTQAEIAAKKMEALERRRRRLAEEKADVYAASQAKTNQHTSSTASQGSRRCTKAEIEQKKLEAIRRRKMKEKEKPARKQI